VGFGFIHQGGEPGELRAQLMGDVAPLPDDRFLRILGESGVDHRQNHLTLTFSGMGQCVADEVGAAALPTGLLIGPATALLLVVIFPCPVLNIGLQLFDLVV
jgi:hypothetical protein